VPKFRYGEAETEDQVGVVTAWWTEVRDADHRGVMMPGKGNIR
jgi:ATP-dependent Lon protease